MSPRGKAPGLKRGRHGQPYWIAKQVVRNPLGFPDKCIPLPRDADEAMLAKFCCEHTARLQSWISEQSKPRADGKPPEPLTHYDGTMTAACRVYQEHPYSPFRKVKYNTRKTYTDSLKLIETTVGARLIRNLNVPNVQHWYDEWRKPATAGGPERIDRAHDTVSMVKTVLRFNAALRRPECKQLAEELGNWQFERGAASDKELTYEQTAAFVRTALDFEARGVMPAGRALCMAIATTAQFDLMLRQKDVIGEHAKNSLDLERAIKRGATRINWDNGDVWTGYFTWENIPGWRWRVKTSKSKYRHVAEFDLTKRSMLFPLLERVPFEERYGAVVKGEGSLPIRERSHRKWWRQIAIAAGIPEDVCNTHARPGAATEADNAGAPLDLIQTGMTHDERSTTLRYLRRRGAKHDALAEIRNAARPKEGQK